jgi:hypothetical protein
MTTSLGLRLNATNNKIVLRATTIKLISLMTSVYRPLYPSERPSIIDLTTFQISPNIVKSKFISR